MGKLLRFEKSNKVDHIAEFIEENKKSIKTCFLFSLRDDGSGNVAYTINNKHDLIFILGELTMLQNHLIKTFYNLDV